MFLTDLADVCRTSRLHVVEEAGWRDRGHGGMGEPLGVVCHHTAGAATGDFPSMRVVRDGRPGLEGPLAQLGLGRSGRVYVIAAGLAWHAGVGSWPGLRGNWDTVGIEAESVGNGTDWTLDQRIAYPRLCAALCNGYGIDPGRVIAHREWTDRKIDPAGIDMGKLRADVRTLLGTGPPAPPDGDEDDMAKPYIVALGGAQWVVAGDLSSRTGIRSGTDLAKLAASGQYLTGFPLTASQMAAIPIAGAVAVTNLEELLPPPIDEE